MSSIQNKFVFIKKETRGLLKFV